MVEQPVNVNSRTRQAITDSLSQTDILEFVPFIIQLYHNVHTEAFIAAAPL